MNRNNLKRKKYNLNLNLADISYDKSKKKIKKKRVDNVEHKKKSKQVSKSNVEDLSTQDVDPGDEFEADVEEISQGDPYMIHLADELSAALHDALSSKPPKVTQESHSWPTAGKFIFIRPDSAESQNREESKILLSDKQNYAHVPVIPTIPVEFSLKRLYIKSQIEANVEKIFSNQTTGGITPLQKELLTLFCNYHDVYYPEVYQTRQDEIRLAYCTHVTNHVVKSRLKILHHNAKLENRSEVPEEYRDQGLMRPKVLIMVPFRESAYRIVQCLISILLGDGGNIMNKKRFLDEYTGDTILMPEKNPKPEDYQLLFSGNTDDNFKMGITITKKCMKLYSDFYASDIIIASPLGLRMLIGAEGEEQRDYDYLASIEIFIMDQAHVLTMQNWEHVLHVLEHVHLQPKDASRGSDLYRARSWALNGWARYYMQSLVFTAHPLPEITALFASKFSNYAGKVIFNNPVINGTISQVIVNVPQMFHYITASSVVEAKEARFQAFISNILPRLKDPDINHILIYIPSYFDFVRLRNHFKRQEMRFVHICEYTAEKKIIRARSKFFHGETKFLLYTERFHFFRRIALRGVHRIVFYEPPSFPPFYSEMCNSLQDTKGGSDPEAGMSIDVLYTKFDVTQVAGLVGSDRAVRMVASERPVHMYMTEVNK